MAEAFLTLGSTVRLLIWIGWTGVGPVTVTATGIGVVAETAVGIGTGAAVGLVAGAAGPARRAGPAATGVVMTMPASGVAPGLPQGWPLTMRTWWMGAADGSEDVSLVASMTGRCSSWGAAIMGGGGAGAMGMVAGAAGLGLTC